MIVADVVGQAVPFLVCGWFALVFTLRARQAGARSTRAHLRRTNRDTFMNLPPNWWRIQVLWGLSMWAALVLASGFAPLAFVVLPVAVLAVPLMTLAIRAAYRRRG